MDVYSEEIDLRKEEAQLVVAKRPPRLKRLQLDCVKFVVKCQGKKKSSS